MALAHRLLIAVFWVLGISEVFWAVGGGMRHKFLFLIILAITGPLGLKAQEATEPRSTLPPLVSLHVYREDGGIRAHRFEYADWISDRLTEPQWESLEYQGRLADIIRRKSYEHYIREFTSKQHFWHLAKLGIWIRFPEKSSNTYYFLPHHRSAREVLSYFDGPDYANLRVDIVWDPMRLDSPGPGYLSAQLVRLYWSDLQTYVRSDQESLLQVLIRIGLNIQESYSAELRLSGDHRELISHCVRYAREIGFLATNEP